MSTTSKHLNKPKVIKNNFGFLRLLFAIVVMVSHTIGIADIDSIKHLKHFLFHGHQAVEGFFIMSGYLIIMSYHHSSSTTSYFKKRFNRIYPTYAITVLASAFLLYFLSDNSFQDYFFNFDWIKYTLANLFFMNFFQASLPGVFDGATVNGSLWTIKIEVMFYLTVPLIVFLISKFNKYIVIFSIYTLSIIYTNVCHTLLVETGSHIYYSLNAQLPAQLVYFISGGLLYYIKDNFKKYRNIYLFFGLIGFILGKYYDIHFIYPISIAIIIIYFSLFVIYLGNYEKFGDMSYGIFLYHYPLANIFLYFNLFQIYGVTAYLSLLILIFLLAYLSWHFIQVPFLGKKSYYKTIESTNS